MKIIKSVLIPIIAVVIATAGIFVGCTVSPKFRDAYTGFSNTYEIKIHDFIEDHTKIDIPYTQYTVDGKIAVIK